MEAQAYDLVVIGSGPAGQKGAIAAAKLGKKVAVVDRRDMLGGASLHTGTIPSKTLREAVLYLSGFRQRPFYGKDYTLKERISVEDLNFRIRAVVERELEVVRSQLKRNGVTLIEGLARFLDPHTIEVEAVAPAARPVGFSSGQAGNVLTLKTQYALIACGTRPARSPQIPVDGVRIFDSDMLQGANEIYRESIVVGAGVIGLEYASIFAALGSRVTVIEQRPGLLDFVDKEIVEMLCYHLRRQGVVFRLGEQVTSVVVNEHGQVIAQLESGKKVHGDALLYTVGRQTNADLLNLQAVDIVPDPRGRIAVNEYFQTTIPNVYAAGDVIGFPALASTSMEQGRLASCHMFGLPCQCYPDLLPFGIYTIPEISMVGKTEQELTEARIPYEVGIARFEELAKGQILGAEPGLLKILFDPAARNILGIHIIGEQAAELIHVGLAVVALEGTIEFFRDMVFNYPTLAEAYKVAALNGLNKIA
ncbi:MAG: Si-specific NAD(P)(+) transhydrogenase [Acidobacteriota bacterium]